MIPLLIWSYTILEYRVGLLAGGRGPRLGRLRWNLFWTCPILLRQLEVWHNGLWTWGKMMKHSRYQPRSEAIIPTHNLCLRVMPRSRGIHVIIKRASVSKCPSDGIWQNFFWRQITRDGPFWRQGFGNVSLCQPICNLGISILWQKLAIKLTDHPVGMRFNNCFRL